MSYCCSSTLNISKGVKVSLNYNKIYGDGISGYFNLYLI